MKKLAALSFLLFFTIILFAQTDSVETSLQRYKDMFVKGLITSQEYEQLKHQTLGIKPIQQQPTTIVIKQPTVKAEIDSVQAKKMRNRYTGNIAAGVGGIVLGVSLIAGAVVAKSNDKEGQQVDGQLIKSNRPTVIALGVFGAASSLIGIVGMSVGISQRHQVKEYDKSIALKLSLNSISLAYNF